MKTVFSESFLRVALVAFNFIFSILSVSLIALGVVYSEQLSAVKSYIGSEFLNFPILLLVLGSISFVVSIAGCFCARSTNRKFFIMFLVTLTLLVALELAISVIAFINIDYEMTNTTRSIMFNQIHSPNPVEKDKFHAIEQTLKCCGINGPEDYLQDDSENITSAHCCGIKNCAEELEDEDSDLWELYGCAEIVAGETQQVAEEAAAVGTIYAVLQILEMACAFLMQRLIA